MIFSLLCKDEWFLMVGFHHCPPMAGNLVFEGTKMSLRGFPSGSRGNLALCPLCHCEPAEGGRGNLKSSVIARALLWRARGNLFKK
jgi:hypothetical protein